MAISETKMQMVIANHFKDECDVNTSIEKDECAKEYEELGLKELKELIKVDRKPNCSEIPNNCEPQTYITEDRDTQILDAWQVHNRNTTSIEAEPQTERSE